MEDSITVAARDAMRQRQAREVSYPQAGGRSKTPENEDMIVEVSPEPAGTTRNSLEPQDDADKSEQGGKTAAKENEMGKEDGSTTGGEGAD